jgi:hypothetical protein
VVAPLQGEQRRSIGTGHVGILTDHDASAAGTTTTAAGSHAPATHREVINSHLVCTPTAPVFIVEGAALRHDGLREKRVAVDAKTGGPVALLPSECRKTMQSMYLCLLADRATVALCGPIFGPVTRPMGAEASSHEVLGMLFRR